jgi:hypothetical protein
VERHVFPQTVVSVNYHYKNPTNRVGLDLTNSKIWLKHCSLSCRDTMMAHLATLKNMKNYPTLYLDTNLCKGIELLLLFCISQSL